MKLRIVHTASAPALAPNPAPAAAPAGVNGRKRLRFDASMDLGSPDTKTFTAVKDANDVVVDYRDVVIKGYLSTFAHVTPEDRDGDYVVVGAFKETIPNFMRNPVLLVDHRNQVDNLAGSFSVVREDSKGLYVEGKLSNSPTERMKHIRALVAEGHLKTLSMGGVFHYHENGRGIFKVTLWEGSLTPIPANPDAIVSTRSLTTEEEQKIESELLAA